MPFYFLHYSKFLNCKGKVVISFTLKIQNQSIQKLPVPCMYSNSYSFSLHFTKILERTICIHHIVTYSFFTVGLLLVLFTLCTILLKTFPIATNKLFRTMFKNILVVLILHHFSWARYNVGYSYPLLTRSFLNYSLNCHITIFSFFYSI